MYNNIAKLRKKLKISQAELANKVGLNRVSLSAIENGVIPTGKNMIKISKALNYHVEDVFILEEKI